MESKQVFDLITDILGGSILGWLLLIAVKDMLSKKGTKRKPVHNIFIIAISTTYIIKTIMNNV